MSRIYTARFDGVAVSAIQDLISIVAPSTNSVMIHEVGFSQGTELADAAEEQLLIQFTSGHTSAGSVGSAPAMVPRSFGDAAAGSTVRANDTTQASAGTIVTHYSWYWNIRIPFQYIWTPETRPLIPPSRRAVFELPAAPADSITMAGYIVFEEMS